MLPGIPSLRTLGARLSQAARRSLTNSSRPVAQRTASTNPNAPAHATASLHPSTSSSATFGWLLLLGSSVVLVSEVVRRSSGSGDAVLAQAAPAAAADQPQALETKQHASLRYTSQDRAMAAAMGYDLPETADELEALYNPAAPAHDHWHRNWDGLQRVPAQIDPASGRPIHVTRHLLLIRHGQYVLPTRETAGKDPVLTELGREQARVTGRRLRDLGYPISTIHCSTMARARETAELIADAFPNGRELVKANDLIREGVPSAHIPQHPSWHPSKHDISVEPPRIAAGFSRYIKRWRADDRGEQIHDELDYNERVQKGQIKDGRALSSSPEMKKLAAARSKREHESGGVTKDSSSSAGTISLSAGIGGSDPGLPPINVDRYELVVCHGNVIRYALLKAMQLPVQAWLRIAIYNTGITHLYVRHNGHVGLQTVGDTGHLQRPQITYH